MSDHSKEGIRKKIKHLLGIYPVISPTMMQAGLGPAYKPAIWRSVLEEMVDEGEVVKEFHTSTNVQGRSNTYTKLFLPGTEVIVRDEFPNANQS